MSLPSSADGFPGAVVVRGQSIEAHSIQYSVFQVPISLFFCFVFLALLPSLCSLAFDPNPRHRGPTVLLLLLSRMQLSSSTTSKGAWTAGDDDEECDPGVGEGILGRGRGQWRGGCGWVFAGKFGLGRRSQCPCQCQFSVSE